MIIVQLGMLEAALVFAEFLLTRGTFDSTTLRTKAHSSGYRLSYDVEV